MEEEVIFICHVEPLPLEQHGFAPVALIIVPLTLAVGLHQVDPAAESHHHKIVILTMTTRNQKLGARSPKLGPQTLRPGS